MNTLLVDSIILEPLTVAHAPSMFIVLSDPALYRYLDYGPPPNLERLRSVYERLEQRASNDGSQLWLNWVAVFEGKPIGFVQATVLKDHRAWVAYVFQQATSGRGLARTSVSEMLKELATTYQVRSFLACVESANSRSIALLEALNFHLAGDEHSSTQGLSPSERLYVGAPSNAA